MLGDVQRQAKVLALWFGSCDLPIWAPVPGNSSCASYLGFCELLQVPSKSSFLLKQIELGFQLIANKTTCSEPLPAASHGLMMKSRFPYRCETLHHTEQLTFYHCPDPFNSFCVFQPSWNFPFKFLWRLERGIGTESCFVDQVRIELMILQPQFSKNWDYKHAPPCLTNFLSCFKIFRPWACPPTLTRLFVMPLPHLLCQSWHTIPPHIVS